MSMLFNDTTGDPASPENSQQRPRETGSSEKSIREWMRDTFVIQASGASNTVGVTTKAATNFTHTLIGVGDSVLNQSGFLITLVSIQGDIYTFQITSICNTRALSHVVFDFGENADISSPTTLRRCRLVEVHPCDSR